MGFSLSASFAIIGATILVAVEIFSGTLIPSTTNIFDSFNQKIDNDFSKYQTELVVDNVTISLNGTNFDFFINLTNTGSRTIELLRCNLLIDGVLHSFISDHDYLFPLNSTMILVNDIQSTGQGRIKMVTKNDFHAYATYSL